MANRKLELYRALKDLGWVPAQAYAKYTLADLEGIAHTPRPEGPGDDSRPPEGLPDLELPEDPKPVSAPPRAQEPPPEELPGMRLNTQAEDEVLRVDEQGRQWIQEEVRKPAYPKPRGRRVLTYMDTGVKQETVQNGEYVETFEVAGDRASRPSEVKITLPSYQVGIYKDPRFPFKVHCYNGMEGFDLHDVHEFYGGSELVPYAARRVYIENDLCYDIRSVIQAINAEYRQIQLTGRPV